MSLRQRLSLGVAWSAVTNVIRLIVALTSFTIMAKTLAPAAFGLSAMVYVVVTFCALFVSAQTVESLVQRDSLEEEHSSIMFWLLQGIAIALILFVFVSKGLVADYFRDPVLADLLPWAMIANYFTALGAVPEALLQRNLRFGALGVANAGGQFAGSITGAGMALAGFGVWSFIGMIVANAVVRTMAIFLRAKWLPRFTVSRRHFNDLWQFNANIWLINFVAYVEYALPSWFMGPILGSTALGHFTIARRITELVAQTINFPIQTISLPAYSKLKHNIDLVKEFLIISTRANAVIAVPAFAGLAVSAGSLIPGLFGDQWVPSVPIIQILSLSAILQASGHFNNTALRALGYPQLNSYSMIVKLALTLILLTAAAPFGLLAMTGAIFAGSVLNWPLSAYLVYRLTQLPITAQLKAYAAPVGAAMVMSLSVWAWASFLYPFKHNVRDVISIIAIGVTVYSASIVLVGKSTLRTIIRAVIPERPPKPESGSNS